MSNVLPDQVISDIKSLAVRGFGIRAISRALGISKNTVAHYYPRQLYPTCPCGGSASHQGWCKHRYKNSLARQAFQAGRSGKRIVVPEPFSISRARARRATILRWLGQTGDLSPIPYQEMYSVIIEAREATRTLPSEFRDDVTQEVIVGACEGRIRRDEIVIAAKFFFGREYGRVNNVNLSIDQIADGRGYDVFLVDRSSND